MWKHSLPPFVLPFRRGNCRWLKISQAQCQSLLAAGLPQSGAVRLTARGTRTAVDGTLAPQLLGGVGAMSAEQWAQKKAQGLAMDESIGQWGLEAAWEDALRGRAGSLKVTVDRSSGGRTETIQSTPQAGDTLHLYLDADLQRTLRSALQQQIETLQATKPEGKGKEARAGAAVPCRGGGGRGCADRRRSGGGQPAGL